MVGLFFDSINISVLWTKHAICDHLFSESKLPEITARHLKDVKSLLIFIF